MTYSTSTTTRWQPWSYRQLEWSGDVTGFSVASSDGEIGKVDRATSDVGNSYLVVDTGPWIFGRRVMLPAGVVTSIDYPSKRVFVDRTKDQIKNAPEFDDSILDDVMYRNRLETYYGEGGPGWFGRR